MTRKILIVEDDPVTRTLLTRILGDREVAVLEAVNGQEGWDIVRREMPDLIIADMLIPKIDGLELCRKIKTDPVLKLVKVVLISAVYKDFHHKTEIRESRADAFIEKPVEAKALRETVKRLLLEADREVET